MFGQVHFCWQSKQDENDHRDEELSRMMDRYIESIGQQPYGRNWTNSSE